MSDGKKILETILYVRDFYSDVQRLLLAADVPLGERGWKPHGRGWKAIPSIERSLARPAFFLPHWVMRQYCRSDRPSNEVLTLAVIPHDPAEDEPEGVVSEPLCLVSRLRARTTEEDRIYWVPLAHMRRKLGVHPYGEVQRIQLDDLRPKKERLAAFEAVVEGGEILSIIVPLVSITDEQSLTRSVVAPIVDASYLSASGE